MKKCITKYLSIALLALAGLALSTSAAKAYTFSDGDLFLGFYESGKSSDYILYIGNYAQYTNGTSFSLNSTIGSASQINTDLTAVFGANWTTAVKWSVIGLQDSTGASTLFATDPGATSSLATLGADSSTNQGGTGTNIVTMAGAFGINGANGATAPKGAIQSISASNSWESFSPIGSNNTGSSFGQFTSTDTTGAGSAYLTQVVATDASSNNVLSLLGADGSSKVEGQFTVASNGSISYAAVPEPSTWAMAGLGAVVLAMATRRKICKA